MAEQKGNQWVLVLGLVVSVLALLYSYRSLSRRAEPSSVTLQTYYVPAPVGSKPIVNSVGAAGIKPSHTEADQAAVAAVKPVPSVVQEAQALVPKPSFAVQVYSFKDKARADAALEKLKAKGFKAFVMVSDMGARGVWYRVRVGSFATEDEARASLDQITAVFKSGIIVTE